MGNKKLGIIGHFAQKADKDFLDGQTIKTKIIYEELKETGAFDTIKIVDTFNWKRNPVGLFFNTAAALASCSQIVILLAKNGLRVFLPLLYVLNKITKTSIHHVVIGGDLPQFVEEHPRWINYLKSFAGNYVETKSMQQALIQKGVINAIYLPNIKRLHIVSPAEIQTLYVEPYKLCIFSRILKEKGIEDAIAAVSEINGEAGRTVYEMDLYGQVLASYQNAFNELMRGVPPYISYKGAVPFDQSVGILKNYFLLLFPTYFESEGFPGTLIDSFSAGLPVIASDWRYNPEIILDQYTGRIFPTRDVDALVRLLRHYAKYPQKIQEMRKNCIDEAIRYKPENVLNPLISALKI